MNDVFLDIETIPNQCPDYAAKVLETIEPPATYKKPESIEKWKAENGAQAAADIIAKTSFDPALGHVCTIGVAVEDSDVSTFHAASVSDEPAIIREFFNGLPMLGQNRFIGHYISEFDLRFIMCRAIILGIKLPDNVAFPRKPKPWDDCIFDTMTAWAGQRGKISLTNLAKALGLEGKGDFDGSQVAQAWANGEHKKIADYCKQDVEITRQVYRKFQAVGY